MSRIHTGLTLLLALCAIPVAARAGVINVPADAPTIQAGVDLAFQGDFVVVADGVYAGVGNRDVVVDTKITVRSASGDPALCETVLHRQGRSRSVQPGPLLADKSLLLHRGDDVIAV